VALGIDPKEVLKEVTGALLAENSSVWKTVLKSSAWALPSKAKSSGLGLLKKAVSFCSFSKAP
jgi:hypothetical protein